MKMTLTITIALLAILIFGYYMLFMKNVKNMDNIKIQIRNSFPTVKHITTDEFKQLMEQVNENNIVLLDVREIEEYKLSHIKNAQLSTGMDEALSILKNVPKDKKIVAYCSVGYRSASLVKQLTAQGYSNILNLEGSIFEWANKDYAVYKQSEKVHQVHPYDPTWGKLLNKTYHPKTKY